VLTVTEARADNDRGLPALQNVSLEVRAGEILGVAGVAGNGQTELEEVIAGLRPLTGGRITVCGQPLPPNARGRTVPGLAHIPSDRYGMAMLKDFSIAENLVLQNVGDPPFTARGFLNRGAIRSNARELVEDFDVRTPSIEAMAGNLSGGNAQKMVLARELSRAPRLLLAAQPTRGLDVAAIEFVHNQLVEQRDSGVGVLLISTELDEILALSDRIAVMYEGQIVGVVDPDAIDVKDIGLMMAGQRAGDAASRGV
jgi:simple sugar transport system ATP-binding protein